MSTTPQPQTVDGMIDQHLARQEAEAQEAEAQRQEQFRKTVDAVGEAMKAAGLSELIPHIAKGAEFNQGYLVMKIQPSPKMKLAPFEVTGKLKVSKTYQDAPVYPKILDQWERSTLENQARAQVFPDFDAHNDDMDF